MQNYQPRPHLLADRIILVTGAGEGIGRSAALTFARYGATLILLGRTRQKLETLYDEIESQGLPQAAIVPLNLEKASFEDYAQLAHSIEQEFGRLDGLLHNAALLGQKTPLANYDPQVWQQLMQVNLNAAFYLTRELYPLLAKSRDASVVFTSSSVGRRGRAFWGAYAVSKFAIEGLMQTWADEVEGVAPIRFNCINPGATRTRMRAKAYPGEDPKSNPLPEEIMALYLYLLGPDAVGVQGQSLDAQSP